MVWLQLAFVRLPVDEWASLRRWLIFATTAGVVLVIALFARRSPGFLLVGAGATLNLLAMAANGGSMPVAYERVLRTSILPYQVSETDIGSQLPGSKDVLLRQDSIRLDLLSDRFHLDPPILRENIFSLGDLVIGAGLAIAAVEILAYVALGSPPSRRPHRELPSPTPGPR